MHRITRTAYAVLVLAAGHAGVSAAHPAADRSCGLITDSDGARIGIVVKRGSVPCGTARRPRARTSFGRLLRWLGVRAQALRLDVATTGAGALPRLASCSRGTKGVAAYSAAD
jgi:hypothetical protein